MCYLEEKTSTFFLFSLSLFFFGGLNLLLNDRVCVF